MYGYVYITINLINNKKYIGQHKSSTFDISYIGSGKNLIPDIKKYGRENFTSKILEWCDSYESLNECERKYILKYNAVNSADFYNIAEGGNGGNAIMGYTDDEKERFRKKMSKITSKENNGMYGKKHTEKTKQKNREISIKNWESGKNIGFTGRRHTEETIELMRRKKLGENNPNYNRDFSENHRKNLSESCKYRTYICYCKKCSTDFLGRSIKQSTCFNCMIKELEYKKNNQNKYTNVCEVCLEKYKTNNKRTKICYDCKIIDVIRRKKMTDKMSCKMYPTKEEVRQLING